MTAFELDTVLAGDTADLGSLGLCRILLMNDARYPWLILVPAKPGLIELSDLDAGDRHVLMDEAVVAGDALDRLYNPAKINTAAIGNIVRQLHVHVVARNEGDPAWPGPVWGHSPARPYTDAARAERIAELRHALDLPADG